MQRHLWQLQGTSDGRELGIAGDEDDEERSAA
jgi:hypothetical protein